MDGVWARCASAAAISPLAQITRGNVGKLTVAWTYRTGETAHTNKPTKFEATPLVVDGTMYLSTPFGRAIALDPATGRERGRTTRTSTMAATGVTSRIAACRRGSIARAPAGARCRRRIYLGTIDARIIALDARTGAVCAGFGDSGTVYLRTGLHNSPYYAEEYELTSPPAVINGMIVTGSAVADNNRTNAASGEVRAFDARTGALRWSWDPVPRDSTDPAWTTWRGAMAHSTGAANAWSVIAADSARDLVFVPTGSASPDYYGGERVGDNRYANSIVALRASTGKVVWHFQAVHHDLWDYDVASPPALVTITHDGRRDRRRAPGDEDRAALRARPRHRAAGVSRRGAARSAEHDLRRTRVADAAVQHGHSPAQPAAVCRSTMSGARRRRSREACLAQIRPLRNEGPFTPPSLEGTSRCRRTSAARTGAGWRSIRRAQIAVVPVNRIAAMRPAHSGSTRSTPTR